MYEDEQHYDDTDNAVNDEKLHCDRAIEPAHLRYNDNSDSVLSGRGRPTRFVLSNQKNKSLNTHIHYAQPRNLIGWISVPSDVHQRS